MAGNGATGIRLELCLLAAVGHSRRLAGSSHGLFSLLMTQIKRLRFGFYSLMLVSLFTGYRYFAVFAIILDRVTDKIKHDLLERHLVRIQQRFEFHVAGDLNIVLLSQRAGKRYAF